MRFGRQLHTRVVPEWANAYVDYDRFKSLLKLEASDTQNPSEHHELSTAVAEAVAEVEDFYLLQLSIIKSQAKHVTGLRADQVSLSTEDTHLTPLELLSTLAECLELHDHAAKLLWYGTVNRVGLKKLLSKMHKLHGALDTSKIETPRSFVVQTECITLLEDLRRVISKFDLAKVRENVAEIGTGSQPTHLGLLFFIKLYGRLPLVSILESSSNASSASETSGTLGKHLIPSLLQLLDKPGNGIWEKDMFGRVPLHYAARYGLADTCVKLLHQMNSTSGSSEWSTQDYEGRTALQLAVANGHAGTVEALLAFSTSKQFLSAATGLKASNAGTDLLTLALRTDSPRMVALLLPHVHDINSCNSRGETALFIAARQGSAECVKILLQIDGESQPDPNIQVGPRGWTPLIVASVQGHAHVTDLLIQAGGDVNIKDATGWTAITHAAYRGHMQLAEALSRWSHLGPLEHVVAGTGSRVSVSAIARDLEIYVNLGPLNTRSKKKPVDLGNYKGSLSLSPHPDTRFAVQISAIGANGSSEQIDLPLLDDLTNSPSKFIAKPGASVTLVFKILLSPAPGESESIHIGSALAFLDALKDNVGDKRESLIRDYTIPILEKDSLDLIGSLTFNFLLVKPLQQAPKPGLSIDDILKPRDSTSVVGHRAFGANNPATRRLQIGENTALGSHAATLLGASFIEFDVQLTTDHVPIIYHDNIVAETGADIPPWALTLDQFMFISKEQELQDAALPWDHRPRSTQTKVKPRSLSSTRFHGERLKIFKERMEHTEDCQTKGFKANVRGDEIADLFATFEEFLKNVPEETGFDIELKYPMLWEAEDANMELYGIELNHYIDTILETVFAYANKRKIFFSSFFPELCILCSRKQQAYPVLFLNDSGNSLTGDIRASNMQEALKFAKAWDLAGVVVASEPLVYSPRLISHTQAQGLVCLSYGGLNNVPEKAKLQANSGLDAICVDEVGLIRNALKA